MKSNVASFVYNLVLFGIKEEKDEDEFEIVLFYFKICIRIRWSNIKISLVDYNII